MLRLVKECSEFIGNRIVGSVKLDYTNRQMRKRDKLGFDGYKYRWATSDLHSFSFITCNEKRSQLRYNYTD